MQNTLALNKCIHNNGEHLIRVQAPIKCSVFGTFSKPIRKCVYCEQRFPLKEGERHEQEATQKKE